MKSSRRNFVKAVTLTGAASVVPAGNLFALPLLTEGEGFVVSPEEQETYLIGPRRAPVTIVFDRQKRGVNDVSLCFEDIVPGDGIPVHKHLNEAEIIFIQKGSGIFLLGDREMEVKEGSAAYVPKGIWHGLKNNGTGTLRMMFSYSPAGFEGYFREIGAPAGVEWAGLTRAEFDAIDKKFGIVYRR